MRNARAAAVLVTLAALPVQGQPPNTIRGRVIADDTDEPVANARVAAPLAGVGTPVVLTDDDGRFTLTIPAGATRLAASKTGLRPFRHACNGWPPDRRHPPATCRRRLRTSRRRRRGTDPGRTGHRHAMRRRDRTMRPPRLLLPTTGANTALPELSAGRYVVSTTAMGASRAEPARAEHGHVLDRRCRPPSYPGASTRAEAEIIALAPGDERPRTDFVIQGGRSSVQPFNALLQIPIVRLPEPTAGATAGGIIRGRRCQHRRPESAFRRRAPVR